MASLGSAQPAQLYTGPLHSLLSDSARVAPRSLAPSLSCCSLTEPPSHTQTRTHTHTHTKIYELAAHLSSRTSCYLNIFPAKPNQHQRHPDTPCTTDSPLLPTGRVLEANVPTHHLSHLPSPGRTQVPASLRALLNAPSFRSCPLMTQASD